MYVGVYQALSLALTWTRRLSWMTSSLSYCSWCSVSPLPHQRSTPRALPPHHFFPTPMWHRPCIRRYIVDSRPHNLSLLRASISFLFGGSIFHLVCLSMLSLTKWIPTEWARNDSAKWIPTEWARFGWTPIVCAIILDPNWIRHIMRWTPIVWVITSDPNYLGQAFLDSNCLGHSVTIGPQSNVPLLKHLDPSFSSLNLPRQPDPNYLWLAICVSQELDPNRISRTTTICATTRELSYLWVSLEESCHIPTYSLERGSTTCSTYSCHQLTLCHLSCCLPHTVQLLVTTQ